MKFYENAKKLFQYLHKRATKIMPLLDNLDYQGYADVDFDIAKLRGIGLEQGDISYMVEMLPLW